MTSRMASKVSEANMMMSPSTLMLISPYEAMAVPKAISTIAMMRRLEGSSSRATKSATMVMTGVNACEHPETRSQDTSHTPSRPLQEILTLFR